MSVATRLFAQMLVLLGAASGVIACGAASPDPDLSRVSAAISGGKPDTVDSNVFVLVSHRGAAGVALCSASLIAPNLLLTARHCVSNVPEEQVVCGMAQASTPFAAGTFYATNIPSINDPSSTTAVVFQGASVAVPPQGNDICGFDVALVTLDSLVPSSLAVPLVPRIDRAVQNGEIYSAVGYGEDQPGDAGVAGVRMDRAGLRVDCAPGGVCGVGVEADEFVGDTGICSGDSGGPALDAAGKVVGVVSRSADDCAHPIYASVASWKDWITGVAQQAATQGGYSPPFWVETGLSDPPAAGASSDAGAEAGAGSAGASAGTQGEACSAPQDCQTGFGCFSPTGTASNAYCAAFCSADAQCASGTVCVSGVGVCAIEPSHESAACAVRSVGSPRSSGGAVLAAFGLSLLGLRRRRALAKRARNLC